MKRPMMLQGLKVVRSIDAQSPPCSSCTQRRTKPRPPPSKDAAGLLLRYLRDGEEIVDILEGRILRHGEAGFEEARAQARAIDGLIDESQRRWEHRHEVDSQPKTVEGVIEKSKSLLEYLDKTTPEPIPVLDDLFDFGPEVRFKDRLPLLVHELSVV